MILTTKAKAGEQMVSVRGCVLLVSEWLAPHPHQVTFTCRLSSSPSPALTSQSCPQLGKV